MTEKILTMSKEELINNIAKVEQEGKELESKINELAEVYSKLKEEADATWEKVDAGLKIMRQLAIANVEMRDVLRVKYHTHVM